MKTKKYKKHYKTEMVMHKMLIISNLVEFDES